MTEFHLFPRLPLELRRMIWKLCLPRRIIDIPGIVRPHGSYNGRCNPFNAKNERPGSPPRIMSVCREAASIVREMGHIEQFACPERTPTWIQPTLDKAFNITHYHVFDQGVGLYISIQAHDYSARFPFDISIAADYLYHFSYPDVGRAHLRPDEVTMEVGSETVYPGPVEQMSIYHVLVDNEDWFGKTLYAQLTVLCIHILPDVVRTSGLFGLLGDELVQSVDVGDTDRLQAFAELISVHDRTEDKKADWSWELGQILHTSFFSSVREWQEGLDWTILAHTWVIHRHNIVNGMISGNLQSMYEAWQPPCTPTQTSIRRDQHTLVESHPWVVQERAKMWNVVPQIMFRVCYEDCYRLPESFESDF